MKLDYLQFLDLEVFTRFATRLEASMEAAIRRGRVLRELLKQDRLAPVSPLFLMAWLVAFNDRRFEGVEPEEAARRLPRLGRGLENTSLTLDSPREEWSRAVADWMEQP
jgi:F-type H+-transporting ATPase subunit alpha